MARNFPELVHRLHGVFPRDLFCSILLESEKSQLRFRLGLKCDTAIEQIVGLERRQREYARGKGLSAKSKDFAPPGQL